jgi:hypothetical protein
MPVKRLWDISRELNQSFSLGSNRLESIFSSISNDEGSPAADTIGMLQEMTAHNTQLLSVSKNHYKIIPKRIIQQSQCVLIALS